MLEDEIEKKLIKNKLKPIFEWWRWEKSIKKKKKTS
jgi:hypothetical protein